MSSTNEPPKDEEIPPPPPPLDDKEFQAKPVIRTRIKEVKVAGDVASRVDESVSQRQKEADRLAAELAKEISEAVKSGSKFETDEENFDKPWLRQGEGIYVDRKSRKALYASLDRVDTGCGWPNFKRTLEERMKAIQAEIKESRHLGVIGQQADSSLGMQRTEVNLGGTHLGHVFEANTEVSESGHVYCINFSKLDFIPKGDMQKKGYGEFLDMFSEKNLKLLPGSKPGAVKFH